MNVAIVVFWKVVYLLIVVLILLGRLFLCFIHLRGLFGFLEVCLVYRIIII